MTAVARPDGLITFGDPTKMEGARLSVLLKGASGSGKTRAALTFPDPIYLLYTDVNRETVRKMARLGVKIHGVRIRSWSEYQDIIVPMLANRRVMYEGQEIKPNTVVVDTLDFLADRMWKEIQGGRSNLTKPDFGTGLNRLSDTTRQLAELTAPMGDHLGYHLVMNVHLKYETDAQGALMKVSPGIMGQFAGKVEDYFDYVFLLQGVAARRIEGGASVPTKNFEVFTAPPDSYNTCKGGDIPTKVVVPDGGSMFSMMNEYWKADRGTKSE